MTRTMKIFGLLVLAIPLIVRAQDTSKGDEAKDLKALEGQWKVISLSIGGTPAFESSLRGIGFEFKGEIMVAFEGGKAGRKYTIKIDPSKSPKQIDITNLAGKTAKGIFELKGNTLKICYDEETKTRPPGFVAGTKHKELFVAVFERVNSK